MFLAEPPSTAYDLRFQLLGIGVRVTPFFWLVAALLGWDFASHLDAAMREIAAAGGRTELARIAASNPGQGMLLLLWIAAVFVATLVHELGHAVVMRRYGMACRVVLYHFGGLAIPEGSGSLAAFRGSSRPGQRIAISAAGPLAELALAGALVAGLRLSGSAILFELPWLDSVLPLTKGRQIPSLPLQAGVYFLLLPCVFWALINLLPVHPLDGGHIARELLTLWSPRGGVRNSLILSVAAGAGVAIYALASQNIFLFLFFGSLAYSSYQVLQAYYGGGGWGGRSW